MAKKISRVPVGDELRQRELAGGLPLSEFA
jgi:hypothetical protein